MIPIKIKLLDCEARGPFQANPNDAGYDLYAAIDRPITLLPGERNLVNIGISVAIPPGFYGRIAPRSGLALKYGIDVLAGVVDSTYRGAVGVVLINLGQNTVVINSGDRVAQLIIERCEQAQWQAVDDLDETVRADAGFGSSGQ